MRNNPRSAWASQFSWAASGVTTMTHSLNITTVNGRRPITVVITEGKGYARNFTADAFDISAESTTGKGWIVPEKLPDEFQA